MVIAACLIPVVDIATHCKIKKGRDGQSFPTELGRETADEIRLTATDDLTVVIIDDTIMVKVIPHDITALEDLSRSIVITKLIHIATIRLPVQLIAHEAVTFIEDRRQLLPVIREGIRLVVRENHNRLIAVHSTERIAVVDDIDLVGDGLVLRRDIPHLILVKREIDTSSPIEVAGLNHVTGEGEFDTPIGYITDIGIRIAEACRTRQVQVEEHIRCLFLIQVKHQAQTIVEHRPVHTKVVLQRRFPSELVVLQLGGVDTDIIRVSNGGIG